ncbi:MAG: glycosyltransferase [Chitinophagia bacterium]|nr:glycosyltransferase [Chitinophagia bacterium]
MINERRKILIVSNRVPYPLTDGGNMAMFAMVEGYHKAGWQVYLLSMNTSRHQVADNVLTGIFNNIYAFEWVYVDNRLTNMKLVKNFLFSTEPEHKERFYQPHFEEKLLEVIATFKPDVVQMESVYLSSYLQAVRSATTAVCILRVHNVEYQIWFALASRSANFFKRKYLKELAKRLKHFEREAWKQYDLLLPITENDSYHINRLEKLTDMIIAPYSIDIRNFPPPDPANERWVGYHLGAMDWNPNREGIKWFIAEVWPKLHKIVPKFEFYFAGRNMPEEFKEIKEPGIFCISEVEEAGKFIADKKILIVPITAAGGIRVKILEAMASGKIVVSTPEGILGIEAKADEHYLPARKPDDFVRAIRWIMMNREEAQKIADRARELIIAKYEHSSVIKKIITEIDDFMRLKNI